MHIIVFRFIQMVVMSESSVSQTGERWTHMQTHTHTTATFFGTVGKSLCDIHTHIHTHSHATEREIER